MAVRAPGYIGVEALREAAGRIEAAGFEVTRATERELLLRRVEDMAWCRDPAGNRIELFHGQATGDGPLSLPRPHGGFRTGRMGMGHMVLHAEDIDAMSAFYRDVLGCVIDEATWTPREVTHGGSIWGHDRLWLDEERRRAANDARRSVIKSGLGAPLQVTRGQFNEVE
jgi:catechol 2,3-dioxygenase-like lactoylglutathione lyase family enzyme